jgi:uncharacterized protein YfaS (alpha-2-macroglobulin family)
MKTTLISLASSLTFAWLAAAAPRLVVSTPSWTPESQIDLVLDSPVVEISNLGKTVDNTWLKIEPNLSGKLVWKAQNIANFVPDRAPAMGTSYAFSIPENRKHLDASEVPAGQFATLNSTPFQIVTATSPNRWRDDYSPSTSEWLIVFNDEIDPQQAANYVSFVSASGQRVAAQLEQATVRKSGYYGNHSRSWTARFSGAEKTDPIDPESAAPCILVATPVSALPPANEWQISLLKGLPNRAASARTVQDANFSIGKIEPFRVTDIHPAVSIEHPRKIVINFNHPLMESLPVDFLTKCVEISPHPENLSAKFEGKQIHLRGDFNDDAYRVTFRPPFPSRGGLDLEQSATEDITFEHLDPELILPSANEAQLANGNRSYRIQTVNLASLQIRLKQLTGENLIRAYQGYRNYTGVGHNHQAIEPTAPLPYPLVAGKTVFEKEIILGNPIDTAKEITLNWNEVLPPELRKTTLFLDIIGTPRADSGSKGHRSAQAIVQLTDIGLAWKLTPDSAFIYAFSCDSGTPLAGVKLQVFGEDASLLDSVVTDASGLASLPRPETARQLHASLAEDNYLTAFDSSLINVGLWHFPVRYSWNKQVGPVRMAFLFTDRSLYRPGETVRLKGIVRTRSGNDLAADVPIAARVVVLDPSAKEIHSTPVTLSATGAFDFTYTLPPNKTGEHTLRLEFPELLTQAEALTEDWAQQEALTANGRFELPLRVEEFRRNAFEITQSIVPPPIGASTVTVDLNAKYYQGQPVAAGSVKHFSRITAQNPYPERFRDYLFGNHRVDDWRYWYHYFGYNDEYQYLDDQMTQSEGAVNLTADGTASLSLTLPQAEFPTAREVLLSTEVTDANHQTLTAMTTATVHPAAVYVGVSRVDTLARAGEALPLRVVATDVAGEPFASPVKVTATLTREVNSAVKTRTDDGSTTTRNDVTEETVITTGLTLEPAASAGQGTPLTVSPRSTGLHFLTVRGTDPEGRPFATVTRFHVYGTNDYPWLYEDGMRVKLVAEKKSYQPGETARILVLSPIEGTALVTVEREKVLRSFPVQLRADHPVIEIPITADDAPNAYVSVLIVKGARESARAHKQPQLRLGYCELIVENLRDRLAVQLEAPTNVRPADQVTLTGSIMLADGSPAVGAEVTMYVEDEGTLAVMGYETPRPMDYFYKPRNLEVETGTSFESFIAEDPDNQNFSNKGFFVGGGGDLGKIADLLRKNFDPCATWAPALTTDASGNFSHTFQVPDTLTRYRLIAIAHHGAVRFGHTESAMVASKELMLEPKTPRFAHQGDTFEAQLLVQNASEFAGTWEIQMQTAQRPETPAVVATGPVVTSVSLEPGASTTVVFPCRAETTGEAVLTWRATPVALNSSHLNAALSHRLSDRVESRFQVAYPMPLLRQTQLIRLDQPGRKINLRDHLDASLLDGTGTLDLEFSGSLLLEAAGSIDYLLHYPYGCLEQTTSSLIPWLTIESLAPIVPSFENLSEQKIATAIQAGANRLLSMQLPDGSFAYWPGSKEPVPWATSYAGLGLMMAVEKGAQVPPAATAALVKNLEQSLRGIANETSPDALEIHTRSLLVLSLAGAPQDAYQNALVDRLAELPPSARSLLAAAIALADKGNAANLARAKSVLTSKLPLKTNPDGWMPWSADDAYRLIAWLTVDANAPEAAETLDRILRDRNPYGHWRNTWVNGWTLLALARYADNHHRKSQTVNFTLGKEAVQLNENQPTASRTRVLEPDLELDLAADQPAYVRVNVAAKPKISPISPVATNGLAIDRMYERIAGDGSATVLTEPQIGDLIRVSLRITLPNDDTRYLAIEDPLPAIFETVNTDFKSQRAAVGVSTSENDWQVSHSELRTDRAAFFLDHIWRKGTYTLTYLVRCTLAGEATAPPAKVESMYDPETYALSASRVFASK